MPEHSFNKISFMWNLIYRIAGYELLNQHYTKKKTIEVIPLLTSTIHADAAATTIPQESWFYKVSLR